MVYMGHGRYLAKKKKVEKALIKVVVITVSDRSSRAERPDTSGPALASEIRELNWELIDSEIIPDDLEIIIDRLNYWVGKNADLILTTGGTGFSPRDNTPEATLQVVDRPAPGIAEGMRSASIKITPYAMLSRAVAGIKNTSLIINLPGSPKAAIENFAAIKMIIPHAVALLHHDGLEDSNHLLI